MHRVTKSILSFLVASLLVFATATPSLTQGTGIYLDFRNEKLSATIEDAPLRDILWMIKKKKRIGYKVWSTGKPILDEKVSVRFRGLSVLRGMERIFSGVNHSFIFERNKIVSVMIFGKKRTHRSTTRSVRDRGRFTRRRP